MKPLYALLSIAAVLVVTGSAQAASSWSAGFSACSSYSSSTSTVTCTSTTGVDAVQVTAVGTDAYAAGSSFYLKDVNYYSGGGLGVDPLGWNEGSPEHSIDNNSYIDAVVIKLDSSVILNQVTLGWRYQDWDFSVFAYTGNGTPDILTSPTALKLNGTLGGDWTLVSNYASVGGCSSSCSDDLGISGLNSGNVSSSWWVISAYSDSYGTTSTTGPGALGTGTRDYFKLLSVAGMTVDTPGVPEPGSLALAGLALAGLFASRRKVKALF